MESQVLTGYLLIISGIQRPFFLYYSWALLLYENKVLISYQWRAYSFISLFLVRAFTIVIPLSLHVCTGYQMLRLVFSSAIFFLESQHLFFITSGRL